MTEEDPYTSIEDQVHDLEQKLGDFVEALCEARNSDGFDPIHDKPTHFDPQEAHFTRLVEDIRATNNIVNELSFSAALETLTKLRAPDNGYNYIQTAVLFDLAIHVRNVGAVHHDLPHLLLISILRDFAVQWLLDFWPFLELRIGQFSQYGSEGLPLSSKKHPGAVTIMTLNRKLDEFQGNNEPLRDVLKSKILMFTTGIFPPFESFISNPKLEQNLFTEKEHEFKASKRTSQFVIFWNLQKFFQDPISVLRRQNLDVLDKDIRAMITLLQETERAHRPSSRGHLDNSEERYLKTSLSEARREELAKSFDSKIYTPTFFINEEKFQEQIRVDGSLRRIFYCQLFFTISFIVNLLENAEVADLGKKNGDIANFVNSRSNFDFLLKYQGDLQKIIQDNYPELSYSLKRSEIEEISNLKHSIHQYDSFVAIYEAFRLDLKTLQKLKDVKKDRASFWAPYGTTQISSHWKTKTGLELLETDPPTRSIEAVQEKIEAFRYAIKDDPTSKDLNTWKALRLARNVSLSKLTKVNLSVGLEGLFDGSLKERYDEEKRAKLAQEDARREEEEEELKKKDESKSQLEREKRLKLEALREEANKKRIEAKLHSSDVLLDADVDGNEGEEEKKRKASQDLFEEQRKKAKMESSQPSEDVELDY